MMNWSNLLSGKKGSTALGLASVLQGKSTEEILNPKKPLDNVPKVGVREFITSSDYFNMPYFYDSSLDIIEEMTAEGIRGYIMEAGLGCGKSYLAAALTAYLCYRVLYDEIFLGVNIREVCDLSPITRVDFVNVALKASAAKDIIFDLIQKAINDSPWFQQYAPHDKRRASCIHFPIGKGGYRIYPGNSEISSIVGQGVLVALVDEANLFKNTDQGKNKGKGRDQVALMFDEAWARVKSRFGKYGYLGIMSSRKTVSDFTARKKKQIEQDPYMSKMFFLPPLMSSWSLWTEHRAAKQKWRAFDKNSMKFASKEVEYDVMKKIDLVLPKMWIPEDFFSDFSSQPEEALRDIASIPSETEEPYFRRKSAILPDFELQNPVKPHVKPHDWMSCETPEDFEACFHDWFYAEKGVRYHFHIDLALNGDNAGIAIAHKSGMDKEILFKDQSRPERAILVDLDLAIHMSAPRDGEIEFEQVRKLLYWLRDYRGFKFGMSSFDGWQSVDSRQILKRAGFLVEYFSVDVNLVAYSTLKDLIYQQRFFFPPPFQQKESEEIADIADLTEWSDQGDSMALFQKELRQLMLVLGKKVDHPDDGSKDVSDAVAGAVSQVIRTYNAAKSKLGDKKKK